MFGSIQNMSKQYGMLERWSSINLNNFKLTFIWEVRKEQIMHEKWFSTIRRHSLMDFDGLYRLNEFGFELEYL
jgi:hypothetical protein